MRTCAWVLLALFFMATPWGCASSNNAAFPSASTEPTGSVLLVHDEPLGRGLTSQITHVRLTGLGQDLVTVTSGPHTRVRAPRITYSGLPLTTRAVHLDYLNGETVVGRHSERVAISGGGTATITNPNWVAQPQPPEPDPALGQFGADLSAINATNYPVGLLSSQIPANPFFTGPGASPSPLPTAFRLTNLPPVGKQGTLNSPGSPGTCLAWGFGYGLGTYTSARNPDMTINPAVSVTSAADQFSPAWLFSFVKNFENRPDCSGTSENYLPYLTAFGSPSRAQVAAAAMYNNDYLPDCKYLTNLVNVTSPPFAGSAQRSLGSFAHLRVSALSLTDLKQFLVSNQALAFVGPVFPNFGPAPKFNAGVFYAGDVPNGNGTTKPDSGHCMLLIGYDDSVGNATLGKGAFLIQNSFGSDWPPAESGSSAPPGYFYMAYDTFMKNQNLMGLAYPVNATAPTSGTLNTTTTGAPAAALTGAYQWVGNQTQCFLVVNHWFSGPVQLTNVTLSEPGESGLKLTQNFGVATRNGVTYWVRNDGRSFVGGVYTFSYQTADLNTNQTITYTGTLTVPANNQLPAASAVGITVLGTTRQAAISP